MSKVVMEFRFSVNNAQIFRASENPAYRELETPNSILTSR